MRNLRCKLCLGVSVQNVHVERGCLCEAGKFSYVRYLTISVHGRVACFLASIGLLLIIVILFCILCFPLLSYCWSSSLGCHLSYENLESWQLETVDIHWIVVV